MKLRPLVFCLLTSVFCLVPSRAQSLRPNVGDDMVKGAAATTLLRQIETDRNTLLEERRQALLRAAQAKTPEAKLKIMHELQDAQRERRAKLKEDSAKVREAEKQDRANKRQKPATPTKG